MRKLAHKQLEGGAGVEAVLDVARRHRELIEVGEQPGNRSARKHVLPQRMTVAPKGQRETRMLECLRGVSGAPFFQSEDQGSRGFRLVAGPTRNSTCCG